MPANAENSETTGNDEDLPTPDRLLHTGSEHPIDPEDLVRLTGREPTPARIERARRMLDREGPAAVERYLP
ncbi:hypothetical protein [Streptomyces sp. 6N223]|uniref:hypothetical protein n=1 Tax=Streptomyces sp. 6N223 TaxID=3457412 RepID=UPI003FD3EB8B